jgi:hypothetical protein
MAAFGFHHLSNQLVSGAGSKVVEEALELRAVFDGLELLVFQA